jgi:Zn-finger domain-containing protein
VRVLSGGSEDPFFSLLLYLIASARDCVDEPAVYGPFRLIDGASRLVSALENAGGVVLDPYLAELRDLIEENKYLVIDNRDEFLAWLDSLLGRAAAETVRRNLPSQQLRNGGD